MKGVIDIVMVDAHWDLNTLSVYTKKGVAKCYSFSNPIEFAGAAI